MTQEAGAQPPKRSRGEQHRHGSKAGSERQRRRGGGKPPKSSAEITARSVAVDTLFRIETQGAYANLALAGALKSTNLDSRDRAMATELVYGTTRMRRACDWLVDRFLLDEIEPRVRTVLRLGAYQLAYMGTPAHAAVSATVDVAPRRARGLVNAVLRKVASNPVDPDAGPSEEGWPSQAVELSYPDWIVTRLSDELGVERAVAALSAMNEPAVVTERADGYIQDPASQAVVDQFDIQPGMVAIDVCAAPGGKATLLATRGASVVAADVSTKRAGLMVSNIERLGLSGQINVLVADGRASPWAARCADVVLVDAPCSGLGSLRRRADARWRINPADVERLSLLQHELVMAAADLVVEGGQLVYSVCTMLAAETQEVDSRLRALRPHLQPIPPEAPFEPFGTGGLLLPTSQGSDGMACFVYRHAGS